MSLVDRKKSKFQLEDSSDGANPEESEVKDKFVEQEYDAENLKEDGSYNSKILQKISKSREGIKQGSHTRTLSSDENANLLQESGRKDPKD